MKSILIAIFSVTVTLGIAGLLTRSAPRQSATPPVATWLPSVSAAAIAQPQEPKHLSCPFHALATSDNDIRLDKDKRPKAKSIALPNSVGGAIRKSAEERLIQISRGAAAAGFNRDDTDWFWQNCNSVLADAYRLHAPNGIDVYVVPISIATFGEDYLLVPFSPARGAVAPRKLWLAAKWTNGFGFKNWLNHPPIFRFERSNDGALQLVFSEYAHNGNVYNAVIQRHFEFANDLTLHQVMAIETKVLLLDRDAMLVRVASPIGRGAYRIKVLEREKGKPDKLRGTYDLFRNAPGMVFQPGRWSTASADERLSLVTYCAQAESPQRFQEHACDFYY